MRLSIRLVPLAVLPLLVAAAASAGPITKTPLYQEGGSVFDSLMTAPTTDYLYFQALQRVELVNVITYGEPTNYHQGQSNFRWQLFHTDANWQTPHGNADRVFYEQFFFTDLGRAEYPRPVGVILEEGAYYRLSFQIANGDWIQPFYTNDSGTPFTTSDGLFQVFGYGFLGPDTSRTSTYLLETTQPVPEPASLLLLGTGLAGLIAARRRRQ